MNIHASENILFIPDGGITFISVKSGRNTLVDGINHFLT